MTKNILIAIDKFKGSISADEICSTLKSTIEGKDSTVIVTSCPLADGGDGSLDILSRYITFQSTSYNTVDPIGRPIQTTFQRHDNDAYIELAHASGIVLLKEAEKNPLLTSTFGTGLQIKNAVELGARHINLFLGGSATNDGGMGIAHALGFRFYDRDDNELNPIGKSLIQVAKIIPPVETLDIESIKLWCDVDNPPFGSNGAAYVYGKQKGASPEDIILLNAGLENLCQKIKQFNGNDLVALKGGGAAGGVAVCLNGLLNADIVSGISMISQIADLDKKIKNADLVISGEGRLDSQSLSGKVVSGVADLCQKYNKPLWLVVGKNDLKKSQTDQIGVNHVFSIIERATNLDDAIKNSKVYLRKIATDMSKLI